MGQLQTAFFHLPHPFLPCLAFELHINIFYYCCSQVPIFQSSSAFPLFWFYIVALCLLHLFFAATAVAANTDDMLMFAILIQTPPNPLYGLEFEPQAYGQIHNSTYIIPVEYIRMVYLFIFVVQLTD